MSVNLIFHVKLRSRPAATTETTVNDVLCSFIKEEDITLVLINYDHAFFEIVEQLFIPRAHYLSLNKVKAHFGYDQVGEEENQALPEYVQKCDYRNAHRLLTLFVDKTSHDWIQDQHHGVTYKTRPKVKVKHNERESIQNQ